MSASAPLAPSLAPALPPAPSSDVQQLLMRFTGTLNRRRAYAADHPMVRAAESQLFESVIIALDGRPMMTIGVARHELLIDGTPYVTKSSYARELAQRLHRRGVGAVALHAGVTLLSIRGMIAWLALEPDLEATDVAKQLPTLAGVHIMPVAYDLLGLSDTSRAASATSDRLWQALAQIAGDAGHVAGGESRVREAAAPDVADTDDMLDFLRTAMQRPDVTQRTATALRDLAAEAINTTREERERVGAMLHGALTRLGASSFAPIIKSIGDRSAQLTFVSQVVDVLPAVAVSEWLRQAASSQEQQMSHHLLRLMAKLADDTGDGGSEAGDLEFRGAAQDLVKGWTLEDPNPEEHIALMDRIAMHEQLTVAGIYPIETTQVSVIESSRLVQMALELDVVSDDADAAALALVDAGRTAELLQWSHETGVTPSALRIHQLATGEHAVRRLLLSEPVDRLEARALLEQLDASSTLVLLDVLEAATTRGTRLIVRQRLSEFGGVITPHLLARLDDAPWYLIRNILTLLQDITAPDAGSGLSMPTLSSLLQHSQVQVRVEAFRLLAADESTRQDALRQALADGHERVVALALQSLIDAGEDSSLFTPETSTQLMKLVDSGAHGDSLRARIVRVLAFIHDDRIRDWAIGHVTRRTRVFRRLSLVEPSPTAIAAVQVLAWRYANHPAAAQVLLLVRESDNERSWQLRGTHGPTEMVA